MVFLHESHVDWQIIDCFSKWEIIDEYMICSRVLQQMLVSEIGL